MTIWRFDQGRLNYFQFDEIKRMACALIEIDDTVKPNVDGDILRSVLSKYSACPFAPASYTVWRNYKRVFGCLLLATELSGNIVCTDVCKLLATNNEIDVDDYLHHFATNFYYPSPVFEGYSATEKQVFPAVAVVKFLVSKFLLTNQPSITVEEVAHYLIANDVTGIEPVEFYATLKPASFNGDLRQPRELIRFISQFSFLKWNHPALYLEVNSRADALQILTLFEPQIAMRQSAAPAELLRLGGYFQGTQLSNLTVNQVNVIDTEFTEGSKIRVTHLRTERSAKLKEFYFINTKNPQICDMCAVDTVRKYPWIKRIIEIHHLLPLSSPVKVETGKTSIKDIVGICPSCHRATHQFYHQWLQAHQRKDFHNDAEAKHVYELAKCEIVIE